MAPTPAQRSTWHLGLPPPPTTCISGEHLTCQDRCGQGGSRQEPEDKYYGSVGCVGLRTDFLQDSVNVSSLPYNCLNDIFSSSLYCKKTEHTDSIQIRVN